MFLSIITINRNNSEALKATLNSVAIQSFCDYEYIVIDGNSSDGSVDVIKEFEEAYSKRNMPYKWVSEPDSGIYNAMNKGIDMATGDYLLFLNSGDTLCDKKILDSVHKLHDGSDILLGSVNVVQGDKIILKDNGISHGLSLFALYLYGIPHQGSFIKRSLFDKYKYDESLKINSDWKFFIQKIVLENASVQILQLTVANYDNDGLSSNNKELLLMERKQVFDQLFPPRVVSDYEKVFANYYEIYRVEWLLKHRFFYKLYRFIASVGMRLYAK